MANEDKGSGARSRSKSDPFVMPFGKHKGQMLHELPEDYLEWLGTVELREPLKTLRAVEVERRKRGDPVPVVAPPAPEEDAFGDRMCEELRPLALELIRLGESEVRKGIGRREWASQLPRVVLALKTFVGEVKP
jgi:hypothetical protein